VNTRAPSKLSIAAIAAFSGVCVGVLLFLWVSFGGSVPLAGQGYRITAEFNQATELGTQAAVDIAGVQIGTVVTVSLDRQTGLTKAVMQINSRYAPRPADTRAILRQKSLLGETYVELSPGNPHNGMLRDGARLSQGQVSDTVQLDQILSTFNPQTRQAFETWMQDGGVALGGRAEDLSSALAALYPFASNANTVLSVLRRDSGSTSSLLADGGQVFSALSADPGQLQALIRDADTVFTTTASRNRALAAAIKALPAFLTGTKETVAQLSSFASATDPLIKELQPAATQLSPALQRLVTLAPQLRNLMDAVAPLTAASRGGEPAIEKFLTASEPLLARATPYLGGVIPILDYVNKYRRELAAFFANTAATTQATSASLTSSALKHYLRISAPVNPEALTSYTNRPDSNRSNPYMAPGGYNQLLKGLETFGSYLCTSNPLPTIGSGVPATLASVLQSVYFTDDPSGPACRAQAPLGLSKSFPQLQPLQ
jgi:phospholipid/cholesterol/gamma-HCH transport system substrate-binding protein